MNDQVTDKIFEYIDEISKSLGAASQEGLRILIKQQITSGITSLIVTVFAIFLILTVVVIVRKLFKWMHADRVKNDNDWSDYPEIIIPAVVLLMAVVVTSIVLLSETVPTAIMKIANPEYYAIKDILDAMNSK